MTDQFKTETPMQEYAWCGVDLDVVRRCMLRGSIILDLDCVVTASPVNRCMLVAKALHAASAKSNDIQDLVEQSSIMNGLRAEAIARKSNVRVADMLPALFNPMPVDRPGVACV